MKYVWQRINKANHNHYICEVFCKTNPSDTPVWKRYFDGTQAKALEHFKHSKGDLSELQAFIETLCSLSDGYNYERDMMLRDQELQTRIRGALW